MADKDAGMYTHTIFAASIITAIDWNSKLAYQPVLLQTISTFHCSKTAPASGENMPEKQGLKPVCHFMQDGLILVLLIPNSPNCQLVFWLVCVDAQAAWALLLTYA